LIDSSLPATINDYIITLHCINHVIDTNRRSQGVSQGTEDGEDYVFSQYGSGGRGDVCRRGRRQVDCTAEFHRQHEKKRCRGQVAQRVPAVRVRQRQSVHVATRRSVRGRQRESGLPVNDRYVPRIYRGRGFGPSGKSPTAPITISPNA